MLVLGSGCARSFTVAPVNPAPTGEYHEGKWVWFDLLTHDADAADRFYSELFGWEVAAAVDGEGNPFLDISLRGRPIAAMVELDEREQDMSRARWIPYMSVADVDASVTLVEGRGGEVLAEPQDLADRGRIAVVRDPQGAVFGLLASATGDPPDVDAVPGGFLWNELWTPDVQTSVDFYHALAGYRHVVVDFPTGGDYDVLQAEERPRAGVVPIPFEEVRPNWLPYVLVNDPLAVVARVEELGGAVLLPPHEELRSGSVAIIADPSGAAITIQKWPIEGEGRGGFPQ
jgi:predicted enzyme related to lactoylglutathione lyase